MALLGNDLDQITTHKQHNAILTTIYYHGRL